MRNKKIKLGSVAEEILKWIGILIIILLILRAFGVI
jgi:hypothetical protein